jgi:hypothetical protein
MTNPNEPTLFPRSDSDQTDWVSPRLAGQLHGLTEADVEALVTAGKVRVATINKQRCVAEIDVERASKESGKKGASE